MSVSNAIQHMTLQQQQQQLHARKHMACPCPWRYPTVRPCSPCPAPTAHGGSPSSWAVITPRHTAALATCSAASPAVLQSPGRQLQWHRCRPSGSPRTLRTCTATHARASSVSGEGAVEGGRQLVDVLAPLPLLWPVMLAAGAVSVMQALPGVAASVPTHCLALLLAPSLCMHVVAPALDVALGAQPAWRIKPPSVPATDWGARALPACFAGAHIAASLAAYQAAASAAAAASATTLGALPAVVWLLALATGASAGVGNAAAHELIHSRHPAHAAAASALLVWCCNWQYSRSHHHHHLTYCTPEDHTWARKGTGLWPYLPRYLAGGWRLAWQEEARECGRRGRAVWGPHNACLVAALSQVAVAGGVYAVWGVAGLAVHLAGAAIAQFLLAAFDYILHYGLERTQLPGGRWGPASPHSSFNSAHAVENAVLFKVLLHSDHHAVAAKPYGDLGLRASLPSSSKGSAGEASAVDIAAEPRMWPGPLPLSLATALVLVPPLWFKVADPLADAANAAHKLATSGSPGGPV
mmetsp:Transcript_14533/g.36155  ORF Transcript_14533/g.36155 Transcript_14533/m.36155 type:complete len:525 (-) Transcript_14533:209-1783(-)